MKKIFIIVIGGLVTSLSAMAQETYENARISDNDLNGTARYVGMGGAMDALGADISTMSSNPAGTALFRRSAASVSGGLVMQSGTEKFTEGKKTEMSFDQLGFVIAKEVSQNAWLNFGINYHKSKNFNQILRATGRMADGASQGRVSYDKGAYGNVVGLNDIHSNPNHPLGQEVYSSNPCFNQLDWLYYNSVVYNPVIEPTAPFVYHGAEAYDFGRSQRGFIAAYDFNVSGNYDDRFYLGLTFGIKDVHYRNYSEYAELYGANTPQLGGILLEDHRKITGTGYDLTLGLIYRPIDASPFRIGLSVKTPTFYDLKSKNYTAMLIDISEANDYYQGPKNGLLDIENTYEYKIYTPWQFGLSVGHTIGSELALGASVDYADYRFTNSRIDDFGYDDYYYDGADDGTHSDSEMNHNTKGVMKGTFTFKLGGEYKFTPEVALRLGYNYITPRYKSSGYKDGMLYSPGNNFMSTSDYTNWKSTNRITAGLGYSHKKLSVDLAYQFSQTDGTFHPFFDALDITNCAEAVKVSNKRHQLLMTVGCRF